LVDAGLFEGDIVTGCDCPVCGAPLHEVVYEAITILACLVCGGRALSHEQVDAILERREAGFTPEQKRLAQTFKAAHLRLATPAGADDPAPGSAPAVTPREDALACPQCRNAMQRGQWTARHPVPVDRCERCHLVWFDHDELEVLQILVEEETG
jgi:Zn-finger nucleic acid-binding protein